MGCRSASLNRWPGTQGNVPVKDLAEIRVEQLGFRDAIVNCVGARRKSVPPSGPRKGLMTGFYCEAPARCVHTPIYGLNPKSSVRQDTLQQFAGVP